MANFDIWNILGIISIVLLIIYFFKPRNAVWGGLTIGVVIGLAIATLSAVKGSGFDWSIIKKCVISGAIIGFIAELLGVAGDYIKKRCRDYK